MGLFDSYKKSGKYVVVDEKKSMPSNPVETYDVSELVDRIYVAQDALDVKVHQFLEMVNNDPKIVGNFNINEEWRCWLERDLAGSRLIFDPDLKNLDKEALECFQKNYATELEFILSEHSAIDKIAQSIDEYMLFKTCLFNVFNNNKDLPLNLYLEQVFDRAKDFGMSIKRHSKDDLDLVVSFNPLEKINRGDCFFSYDFYVRFNNEYKKECHMYSICMMDVASSESMFSGPVVLPLTNAFSKFSKDTDSYFLDDKDSVFYQQSLKTARKKEKEKYGIPMDFFEGTFIDPDKLISFSEKSYQYGNSKIFIPKSQIAFAGDKVYMKRWLYAKLKRPVELYEAKLHKDTKDSLENKVRSAAAQATAAMPSSEEKSCRRVFEER